MWRSCLLRLHRTATRKKKYFPVNFQGASYHSDIGESEYDSQISLGHAVAQLVEALRYKPEGCGFDSRWCHWNFSLTLSFRPHYGPKIDSASNRNISRNIPCGVKKADVYGWQPYHLHVPTVLKSGSLNLPEPSGPVQTCNGIALPFYTFLSCELHEPVG